MHLHLAAQAEPGDLGTLLDEGIDDGLAPRDDLVLRATRRLHLVRAT